MGKLVVTEYTTLDGVVEAPGGGEDFIHAGWTFRIEHGPDGVAFKLEETRNSDALVFGRVTYDGMAAVWPHMTGEVADLFNTLPKFVISDTVSDPSWNNTEVLRGDLRANVEKLKERFAGEIVVHGSTRIVRQLLELDLIDELRLMVFPLVLGAGKRLFADADAAKRFRLTSATPVGDGIAVLVYRPVYDYLVVRDMPADLDTLWHAWTEPEDYGAWFGALPGTVRLDVRAGGPWSMQLGAGPHDRLSGTYLEVVARQKLVMSTRFESGDTVMEMTFRPSAPGSSIIEIHQESDTPAVRDGGRAGSEILLDQCAAYLSKQS